MNFSDKTLSFLFENCLHDSKEWFHEHKDEYTEYVMTPFTELVNNLQPAFQEIDSRIVCTPKKISRLYKDTRFTKDGSIFRDTVWCSFGHSKELYWGLPGFFIEFSPRGFRYGMGYYQASASSMEAIRTLIMRDDPAWQQALETFEEQTRFELCGELYKKNRYPDYDERTFNWLNRKTLCLIRESTDFTWFFGEDLADKLSADFRSVEPIYYFMMKAESIAGCDRTV